MMFGSKYYLTLTVVAALGVLGCFPKTANAEDAAPGDRPGASSTSEQASEAPSPRSPLRVNTFEYQDNGDQAGMLKLAGVALPGSELYIYFDDQPLGKVVPDEGGQWSLESEMKLEDGRHTIRAEQYDPTTRILAARAMVSIERAKQPPDGAPKAATP
jgi:hypothetical protein